jgi:dTMP kinase
MRGKMISVEGIEGVGKSTLLPLMAETLRQSGIKVIETREPGGTVIGEQIRNVLLHQEEAAIAPVTELTMMFAARAQHLEEVIKPALHSGHWVLCDRFTDSTYAYQGGGRQLSSSLIEKIEHAVIESFQPDHTVLLDLDVIEGLDRAAQTGAKDRFESESIAFFNRVREAYLSRASQFDRITVMSAAPPLKEVSRAVVTWIADIRGHAIDE